MDQGIFIALLNPAISLVIASAFLVFWLVLRKRPHLLALSAGYAVSSLGFLFQRFELPLVGFYGTKLLSNLSFVAGVILIVIAICQRYDRKVPYAGLGILAGAGLTALIWFMFFDPSLTWRILSMNFAFGGITLLVAFEMRAVAGKTFVDRLIYLAAVLTTVNFFARTIAVIYFHGTFDSYDDLYTSFYWSSLLLSHALLSLMVALCLIMAAAMDMFRELRLESGTDPLSGLLNRRGFEERANALCARARPQATPFGLVVADLDHFKSVNDTHGHPVGDAVIAGVARLLQKAGGGKAIIGRTGGEEFALLLPDGDLTSAQLLAERVRAMLAMDTLSGAASVAGKITCSFGVAECAGSESFDAVAKRADDALLHAKRAGRDRVRVVYLRPDITQGDLAAA